MRAGTYSMVDAAHVAPRRFNPLQLHRPHRYWWTALAAGEMIVLSIVSTNLSIFGNEVRRVRQHAAHAHAAVPRVHACVCMHSVHVCALHTGMFIQKGHGMRHRSPSQSAGMFVFARRSN